MQKHIFSMRKHKLTFSPVPASSMQKATLCPIEGFLAAFGGPGVSVPTDRGKGGQDTKHGFLSPLDSPYLPFKPRLPAVARLKKRRRAQI